MIAEIEVLQPGLFSTIQDPGRYGFRDIGVPLSGPLDSYASRLGNLILHNEAESPVLEITQIGPRLKFSAPANIVVTGAELSAEINTVRIKNNRIYKVMAGDVLNFGKRLYGARAYLSIQGGFVCDEVLGSCSWYEGLTPHFRLEKGMRLKFASGWIRKSLSTSAVSIRYDYLIATKVSVFPGPEFY